MLRQTAAVGKLRPPQRGAFSSSARRSSGLKEKPVPHESTGVAEPSGAGCPARPLKVYMSAGPSPGRAGTLLMALYPGGRSVDPSLNRVATPCGVTLGQRNVLPEKNQNPLT
jgi:hypothetical protein